jgi:hypothetical protein
MQSARPFRAMNRHGSPSDPNRNDDSFAKLTALFDKVGIDLLCRNNVGIAASLVSV